MTDQAWIPLTEYSSKYRVSVSTLRRRIKRHQVEYLYEDNKYLIKDLPLNQHEYKTIQDRVTAAPPQSSSGHPEADVESIQEKENIDENPPVEVVEMKKSDQAQTSLDVEKVTAVMEPKASSGPSDETIQNLLNEIKRAYMLILQEKEEQIIQLKEEVVDLRTLARVLEAENKRLHKQQQDPTNIDGWLESL